MLSKLVEYRGRRRHGLFRAAHTGARWRARWKRWRRCPGDDLDLAGPVQPAPVRGALARQPAGVAQLIDARPGDAESLSDLRGREPPRGTFVPAFERQLLDVGPEQPRLRVRTDRPELALDDPSGDAARVNAEELGGLRVRHPVDGVRHAPSVGRFSCCSAATPGASAQSGAQRAHAEREARVASVYFPARSTTTARPPAVQSARAGRAGANN